ncbi:hypothetical protein FHP25_09095 [Vineibacter terrae]|uniref:Aminoglycoside phosphotransferase domain-containing protein n=1 Tax=Vineibacter terrae TaxID=2586908 RepID=A0A5C8PQV2_9HYPH|nr:phosphotransferase [Vineibacter terrae]TXL77576.1 hypothetical protein FHP25_09095 [Vineibacter terrae]
MTGGRPEDLFASAQETARAAQQAAFGRAPVAALAPLSGGASGAFPFRAQVGGRRYLVRVEGPASPLRNPHQYEAMRIAADAGIAPAIHHLDPAARVAVADFVDEQPLSTYPGGRPALVRALAELLGRVQATSPFPAFVEYPAIVARLWAHVCRTGLFAPGVLDAHTARLDAIRRSYAWDPASTVSSHNDPVPRNILFDGARLWLIDWESAYRNDPLVDAAIMLDNLAPAADLQRIFVHAWLGRAPDDAFHARLSQVRALTRLYYAGVLLSASAAAAGALADTDLAAPTAAQLRRAMSDGRLKPGAADTKHVLGKMYLASFLTEVAPPGLDAAT